MSGWAVRRRCGLAETVRLAEAPSLGTRRVVRDALRLMTLTAMGSVLSFGFQWAMARMLEPGQYATMFSLLGLLAILAVPSRVVRVVAIRAAAVTFVRSGGRHLLDRALRAIALASGVGGLVWLAVALASGPIASFLNTTDRAAVVWLGGAAGAATVAPVMQGVLTGARAFAAVGGLGIAEARSVSTALVRCFCPG